MVDRLFGRVLLIACPSIAFRCAELSIDTTLVERRPIKPRKFIDLVQQDLRFSSLGDINGYFDAVVLDPPWYPEYFMTWLEEAMRKTIDGGLIMFSLWPDNIPPSGTIERNILLNNFRRFGDVSVIEGVLGYKTPKFEAEAIKSGGRHLFLPEPNWRRGDLVCIRLRRSVETTLSPKKIWKSPAAIWSRYIFGSLQIAVKIKQIQDFDEGEVWMEPIGFNDDYPLVSRRSKIRKEIGFWTSRNEAFRLAGGASLKSALDELSRGIKPSSSTLNNKALDLFKEHGILKSCDFDGGLAWAHLD